MTKAVRVLRTVPADMGKARYSSKQWMEIIHLDLRELVLNDVKIGTIAKRTGVSHATISSMLYGKTKTPHMRTVMRILTFLGYTLWAEKK